MKLKDKVTGLLHFVRETQDNISFQETAIEEEYKRSEGNGAGVIVNILSIVGGILATLAFMAFLFITGIYHTAISQLFLGVALVATATWLNKQYDAVFLDTLSVTAFISGLILLGTGIATYDIEINPNIFSAIYIMIAVVVLFIARTYVLSFICVLIINGCLLQLILSNHYYQLVDVYTSVLAILLTLLFLNEAKLITTGLAVSRLYNPVLMGLLVSFIAGFALFGLRKLADIPLYSGWIVSAVIIVAILYVIYQLLRTLDIRSGQKQALILLLSLIALLPTAMAPAISGSILVILLGFYVNHRVTIVLGIVSFIYFVIQYYYDLSLTLLTKSIIMFVSGLFFTALYLATHKNLRTDEKI